MALEESGTKFTETIEVDEEKEVEVFRVPAHNNVNGAEFYHDFKEVRFEGFIQSFSYCLVKLIIPLRLVFTSDGVAVGVVIRSVERYDLVKIKPTESEAEH